MVNLAERIRLWDSPLYVDREGLAQHYGLATDMLDVTSNFDVASFFATCAWNSVLRKYEPVTDNLATGVIYRITPALMCSMARPGGPFGPVHIVGWQPLPRPEQQRAFVVKMKPGQDFTSLPTVETFVSCTGRTSRTVFGMLSTRALHYSRQTRPPGLPVEPNL